MDGLGGAPLRHGRWPPAARLHKLVRADCTTRNKRRAARLQANYDQLETRITELAAQEDLARVRPDLDGNEIMTLLGIPPAPKWGGVAVPEGAATRAGPLTHDEARDELWPGGTRGAIVPSDRYGLLPGLAQRNPEVRLHEDEVDRSPDDHALLVDAHLGPAFLGVRVPGEIMGSNPVPAPTRGRTGALLLQSLDSCAQAVGERPLSRCFARVIAVAVAGQGVLRGDRVLLGSAQLLDGWSAPAA